MRPTPPSTARCIACLLLLSFLLVLLSAVQLLPE
jgi:hypothetical protein